MPDTKLSKLKSAFSRNELSHALILETHTGRAEGVESLFQSILCIKGQSEACGTCESCQTPLLMKGDRQHPDFLYTESATDHAYTVEQVREWESSFLFLSRNLSPKKLLVITQAERLSGTQNSAANALLKVLEEPRPHTHVILLSSNSLRLLGTIRSRALKINLKKELPLPSMESNLSNLTEIQAALWGRFANNSELSNPTWWKDKSERIVELEEKLSLLWKSCSEQLAQSTPETAARFWTHWKHYEDFLWAIKHYGNPSLHWLNFKRKVLSGQPWRTSKLFG